MADNDKFLKSIGPCWKKPYEAAYGHGDPCEVSELTVESLCTLLRANGGCPEFEAFQNILEPFFDGSTLVGLWSVAPAEAHQKCDELARHHVNCGVKGALAGIAAKVASALILESQMDGQISGNVGEVFAEKFLLETRRSLFIDRLDCAPKVQARFELAHDGDVLRATDAIFDFQSAIESHIPEGINTAARKLAADASGQTLPKRAKRMPKRSAAEFVNLRIA